MHPLEPQSDVGHVESLFFSFVDIVSVSANRCIVCKKCTIDSKIVLDTPDGSLHR
jgi:hypothetical protein